MKADLHLHTTASDGRLSPEELVRRASGLGIEVISLTDHDSVEGVPAALAEAANHSGLTVIPGVEISTDVQSGEVHMLGYFVDCLDPHLKQSLGELRNSRYERGRKMVAKLANLGVQIDFDRVLELADGGAVGRPHVAQAMLERGYISSFKEAFIRYIGRNGPAYVQRKKLTPVEAMMLVLKAKGLPVLAHPAEVPGVEPLVLNLKKAGMVGLEVYYNGYAPNVVAWLEGLARQHDLIATGGSDYHGIDNGVGSPIGSIDVPRENVERLMAMANRSLEVGR